MLQRQLYDLQAERAPQTSSEQAAPVAERERQLIDWLRQHLSSTPTGSLQIVELGCGEGTLTLELARALSAKVLGAGLRPLGFRDPGARFAQVRRFAPALLAGNLAVLARK